MLFLMTYLLRFICPLFNLFHILFPYLFCFRDCWNLIYYFCFWNLRNFVLHLHFWWTSLSSSILYILYSRILCYLTIKIRSNIMHFFLFTITFFLSWLFKRISRFRNYRGILCTFLLCERIWRRIGIRWILIRILS